MRITITGASGLIGPTLVAELRTRGDDVTVLSRNPARARQTLAQAGPAGAQRAGANDLHGGAAGGSLDAVAWDLMSEPAPAVALAGRDAVVHLAGETVAQRWSSRAKQAIRESRVVGTRQLVEGLRQVAQGPDPSPQVLVSSSAIGYYGPRGEEPIDEEASPGSDFLARVCVAWEGEAQAAGELGVRTVQVRTGIVLDRRGGALRKMLPPFRAGVGGPVAGGRQYMAWIHRDDVVGMMLAALDDERWSGAVNATGPAPVTNRDFSRALGRALHRPAVTPVPGLALRLLYGEMSEIVTTGARAVPAKALMLGYGFRHERLDQALAAALA